MIKLSNATHTSLFFKVVIVRLNNITSSLKESLSRTSSIDLGVLGEISSTWSTSVVVECISLSSVESVLSC